MNTFSFTDEQLFVLRLALMHELNENSYLQGQCNNEAQRRMIDVHRAEIESIYSVITNRRQNTPLDKVANYAEMK